MASNAAIAFQSVQAIAGIVARMPESAIAVYLWAFLNQFITALVDSASVAGLFRHSARTMSIKTLVSGLHGLSIIGSSPNGHPLTNPDTHPIAWSCMGLARFLVPGAVISMFDDWSAIAGVAASKTARGPK